MTLNQLKLSLFVIVILATTTLKAQNIFVGGGGGGGTFGMNSVKEFNQTIIKQLPFNPVLKDNFPPYIFYNGEVIDSLTENLAVGINLSTTSTGSRHSLADYSGHYTFDNIQKGFFPGIKIFYGAESGCLNEFNLLIEGGVSFSNMIINEELKIFEEFQSDKMELEAMGFFFQPGICYFKNITPRIKVCANISYYFGFEKGYYLPKEKNQILYNQETGKPIKPQWDGIRLGITAYWMLPHESK